MVETTEIEKRVRENSFPALLLPLARLAWNYWWSWAPDGISIFRDLDPELWEDCEQNPRQLLARTAQYRLAEAATDPAYIERVQRLITLFEAYMSAAAASALSITTEHPVAYFCAEFGIHNSLPLYSGGLGILAGDHLKSASDLGLPLIAIGLHYRSGYFRQSLSADGWQHENYPALDPQGLPLRLLIGRQGEPVLIQLAMPG